MRENSNIPDDRQSSTDSPPGEDHNSEQEGSSEQAANSPSNSTKDAASGSISEVKARDPEFYAERDVPSE
ncbi:MAG TPA: hypothetical protein VJ183_03645 [Chloroflexia bacterium]|nr:hypothetical protein [Chloroflexia bacterium]